MFDKTETEAALRSLATLGISKHGGLVYMALLRLGETGTSQIIRETELHGQYVYQSLGELEERGLAQHVIKRGRRKYSAKSPKTLVHLAEERKAQAELLANKLSELMVL